MEKRYIGIDLGGTNIKAGVITETGKIVSKASVATGSGPQQVIERMSHAAKQAVTEGRLQMRDIEAVGIASPGPLSSEQGIVIRTANLPGWHHVPVRDMISQALKRPAFLENDAKSAAYGEFTAGAGADEKITNFILITLGTGVGGGIIYHGRLIRGVSDSAAEIGHMIVNPDGEVCGCGQRGCLELYASASRTGKYAQHLLAVAPSRASSLRALLDAGVTIGSREVTEHAKMGDELADEVWDRACRYLALACVNAARWLDPQMLALAGGMAGAGDFLLERVKKHFAALNWKMTETKMEMVLAKLGNDAGMIGAAALARDAHHQR
ncbi:MAG: ROK family protein [Phycisphaerae bacterium]